jgi:hypothetical protein
MNNLATNGVVSVEIKKGASANVQLGTSLNVPAALIESVRCVRTPVLAIIYCWMISRSSSVGSKHRSRVDNWGLLEKIQRSMSEIRDGARYIVCIESDFKLGGKRKSLARAPRPSKRIARRRESDSNWGNAEINGGRNESERAGKRGLASQFSVRFTM